ncbi:hypothetical protein LUZ63_003871 [Rhynchospora breviuscula]|uniref:RING-type domain-containing protein n=1 Tax=Rhynchospora breviuscula TaxID=2022672 RepID=A0A9Q0D2I8_9POAL|nr:hypothetical protein LUZ63_003871 [Rhynchospora breviuscula]
MSSSLGPVGKQAYKRRGMRQPKRGIHITIDLNSPAPAADASNVASSSVSFQNAQSNPSPIYVDDIDDDVQMISGSRFAPSQAPIQAPIVVLDEDEETNPGSSGVAREESYRTINLDLSLDVEMFGTVRKQAPTPTINLIPVEPPWAPPKEPTFSCPVCMSSLVEPSSTICGHIFCKECIKASIQAQKKCPTCRKHLNMKQFHRVYLPTTE